MNARGNRYLTKGGYLYKHSKELDFTGQPIFTGIDTGKKSWDVSITTQQFEHKTFNTATQVEAVVSYLHRHFPGGAYKSVYEAAAWATGSRNSFWSEESSQSWSARLMCPRRAKNGYAKTTGSMRASWPGGCEAEIWKRSMCPAGRPSRTAPWHACARVWRESKQG
ncbi:MAG TPA: hypothetical protein VKA08_15915 [Balneolales bacterium]|nr:hypothetical protein [Balneolales bacterium]